MITTTKKIVTHMALLILSILAIGRFHREQYTLFDSETAYQKFINTAAALISAGKRIVQLYPDENDVHEKFDRKGVPTIVPAKSKRECWIYKTFRKSDVSTWQGEIGYHLPKRNLGIVTVSHWKGFHKVKLCTYHYRIAYGSNLETQGWLVVIHLLS